MTDLCQIYKDLHKLFRTGVILDFRTICVNILKSDKNHSSDFGLISSDAASGWAGWALAQPEFGSSVYGANYAHHITASPPGFESPAAAL